MRSIFIGSRTRRPDSSVTSRNRSLTEGLLVRIREHDAKSKIATNARTRIWSAPEDVARRRFGLFGVPPSGGVELSEAIPRKRGTPNLILKIKIPSPFCLTMATGSDGIFSAQKFPLRPEHLFASVQ